MTSDAVARTRSRSVLAAALLLAVAMCGCGYRRPRLAQVEGIVTLDGESVGGADVLLVPIGPGRAASGVSNDSGRLRFSAYGSGDGIPAGRYKAVVSKRQLKKRAVRKVESLRSKAKATRDETSDEPMAEPMLEFTDDDYENLLPGPYASADTSELVVAIDRRTRQIALALVSSGSNAAPRRP